MRAVVAVSSHGSMFEALLAAATCAILPERSVVGELATGKPVRASPHESHSPLSLAVRENALMETKNDAFLRRLREGVRKRAMGGSPRRKDDDAPRKRSPRK